MLNRVPIFIDGGYLDRVLRDEFNHATIDYQALSQEILAFVHPEAVILRAYYYHCLPYTSRRPTAQESSRFDTMHTFLDSINRIPRYEVKLGNLVRRGPDKQGKYTFEQKMVDVLLSIDLVALSAKGRIMDAVIVAGDADFVPAIDMAKQESVCVWLFHGQNPNHALWDRSDERIRISDEFVNKIRQR